MFTEKNSIYLIAGYAVFLGGIATYLLSLLLRRRNLKRDEESLEQIAEQVRQEQQEQPLTSRSSAL
jgi:membrane protein YqaA with SNARE-associated domain